MKCLVCEHEMVNVEKCDTCGTTIDEQLTTWRDTYAGAAHEFWNAFMNLIRCITETFESGIKLIDIANSIGGKMDIQEPKRISVSQEKKYLSEGWKVVERSECGRYLFVVKE